MPPNVQPQGRPSLLPNDIADVIANLFGGGDQSQTPDVGGAGNVIPPQIQQIIQQISQQFQGVGPQQEPGQQGFVDPNAQQSISDEELAQMLGGGGGQDQMQGDAGGDQLQQTAQTDGAGQPAMPSQGGFDPSQMMDSATADPMSIEQLLNTPIAGDAGAVADELAGTDPSGGGMVQSDVGPQQAVSDAPPVDPGSDVVAAPAAGTGALPPLRPAQETRKTGYMGSGVDEAYADKLARMPFDQATALFGAYQRSHPIDRTPPIPDAAVEQIAKLHPTIADDVRAAHAAGQDQSIPGLVSQDVARQHPTGTPPRAPIDMSQFTPQVQQYLRNMSPDDQSKFIAKQLAAQQGGGAADYWPRLKGHGIKIVNDDNFKRLGLKSGEKVCITVP
jgi:hypothetical protein